MFVRRNGLEAVALTGALIWGVWSLIPVAVGVLAAFIAIVYYGFSAFTVPAWALGIGAASALFTASICALLRGSARARLIDLICTVAWMSAALFVAAGAMSALLTLMPDMPSANPNSPSANINGNLQGMATGLKTFYAWLLTVVIPMVLAGLAGLQLIKAHRDR